MTRAWKNNHDFELAATEELKRWLLSFGMHAEVLEPPEFREELRVEIEGMQKCYSISSRRTVKRIDNDE
ncbi:MAG: WYL domain-containing protein [Thermoguttaceae bacterium]